MQGAAKTNPLRRLRLLEAARLVRSAEALARLAAALLLDDYYKEPREPKRPARPAEPAGDAAAAPRARRRGRRKKQNGLNDNDSERVHGSHVHADVQMAGQDTKGVSIAEQLSEPSDVDARRTPPAVTSSLSTAVAGGSRMTSACESLFKDFTALVENVGLDVLNQPPFEALMTSFVQNVTCNNEEAARTAYMRLCAADPDFRHDYGSSDIDSVAS